MMSLPDDYYDDWPVFDDPDYLWNPESDGVNWGMREEQPSDQEIFEDNPTTDDYLADD
jgi:hypothetical protein